MPNHFVGHEGVVLGEGMVLFGARTLSNFETLYLSETKLTYPLR